MPTLMAKIHSIAPRSWSWPAARRTSFHALSTRLASATVNSSENMQPIRIVLMPAVTKPVTYSTWEPIQNQASGCGPKRVRQRRVSTPSRPAATRLSTRLRPPSGSPIGLRYRTGPVPGRRPMKSPPVSEGSLLAK